MIESFAGHRKQRDVARGPEVADREGGGGDGRERGENTQRRLLLHL